MSEPDLFVVCKNCGSEVSPYITECPYCGTRLRKRAPKLERRGEGLEAKPRRRGADRGNDLIGVAVFAAVLLLVPLADTDASVFAGLGGAAIGAVAGAIVSPFRP